VNARGLKNDRRWMLVDSNNKFVTMREQSKLGLIQPSFQYAHSPTELDYLVLTWTDKNKPLPGNNSNVKIAIPPEYPHNNFTYTENVKQRSGAGNKLQVVIWGETCTAIDEGFEVAEFFKKCIGVELRLVRMAEDFVRTLDPDWAPANLVKTDNKPSQVGFTDGYPFLVISEASLEELSKRIPASTPNFIMRRFRPNIVLSGCQPFEEDKIHEFKIGDITFEVLKPCSRCRITTVDPATGVPDPKAEPLNTLYKIRSGDAKGPYCTKKPNDKGPKGFFGQNVVHRNVGTITVGQIVKILSHLPEDIAFTPILK